MPEVGIGFFPDVGMTYRLSRPGLGELGTHIALAAPLLSGGDALAAGLADFSIPAARLGEVPEVLIGCGGAAAVTKALSVQAGGETPGTLGAARGWIDECYAGGDVVAMVARLARHPAAEARAAAAEILGKSPISLKQTLRLLRQARELPDLAGCLAVEYRVAVQFTATADFLEGVRAAIIDKDRAPRWSVANLEQVTDDLLDRLFPTQGHGLDPLFAKQGSER